MQKAELQEIGDMEIERSRDRAAGQGEGRSEKLEARVQK